MFPRGSSCTCARNRTTASGGASLVRAEGPSGRTPAKRVEAHPCTQHRPGTIPGRSMLPSAQAFILFSPGKETDSSGLSHQFILGLRSFLHPWMG